MANISMSELEVLKEKGYLRSQTHPFLPLTVWNYTPIVQYERLFGDYPLLRQCRGLVTDETGVVARGFEKFFNLEEHHVSELPGSNDVVEITKKLDGSLILAFKYLHRGENKLVVCTRGSFDSSQAKQAKVILVNQFPHVDLLNGYTYLFEFVSPTNRIVVPYSETKLILLAIVQNKLEHGLPVELDIEKLDKPSPFFEINKPLQTELFSLDSCKKLQALNIPKEEGFVIRMPETNFRFKIKFEEYKRLHKIVTGVSTKSIWETLKAGQGLEEILDNVPDEFNKFVQNTVDRLNEKFEELERAIKLGYLEVSNFPTRKDQALFILEHYKDVAPGIFNMIDGEDYTGYIWDKIEPKFYSPFASNERA